MQTEFPKSPPESAGAELAWAHPLVRDWFVAVQKGPMPLDEGFNLRDSTRMRGESLWLI